MSTHTFTVTIDSSAPVGTLRSELEQACKHRFSHVRVSSAGREVTISTAIPSCPVKGCELPSHQHAAPPPGTRETAL